MRRTVPIVNADQESEVATDILNFASKALQAFVEDPAGDRLLVETMVFHEGWRRA
jgi:hypothetical protein